MPRVLSNWWAFTSRSSSATKHCFPQLRTRQALNASRGRARRREEHVGPWLPEPVMTMPDIAEDVVLSESVSTAMMVVMDTLAPVDRTIFVLREVFGLRTRRLPGLSIVRLRRCGRSPIVHADVFALRSVNLVPNRRMKRASGSLVHWCGRCRSATLRGC